MTPDVKDVSDTSEEFKKKLEPDGLSIVIPTFNRSESVARGLVSIFKQRYDGPPIQIIIVDDGSTDNFWSIVPPIVELRPDWVDDIVICRRPCSTKDWSSPANSYNYGFQFVSKNYVAHFGSDMMMCSNDVLTSIIKHCDVDRYLYFMLKRIPLQFLHRITFEHIFDDAMEIGNDNPTGYFYPYVAVTSLDALQKINFYSTGFMQGQGDDNELLEKLYTINIKFTRIVDRFVAHQDHPTIGVVNTAHNHSVWRSGVNSLKKKIENGEVEVYI